MRWNIREAVDVYFRAKSAFQLGARTFRIGEPVLIFDTVTTSTLEVASETSYLTGGRGNSRILSFEGDKTLSFNFEEALLSAEGMAILSGADLIPARNKNLPGAAPGARSVISHFTEKQSITTSNRIDRYEGTGTDNPRNIYPDDKSLGAAGILNPNLKPRGGKDNIWMTKKPYVGQNGSIYVMLLDDAGEVSGSPIEINLKTNGEPLSDPDAGLDGSTIYLRKFISGDNFIAFNDSGLPLSLADHPIEAPKATKVITETWHKGIDVTDPDYLVNTLTSDYAGGDKVDGDVVRTPTTGYESDDTYKVEKFVGDLNLDDVQAIFDDGVKYYVDYESANRNWVSGWGKIGLYKRTITASNYDDKAGLYRYLLEPSGGVAQPKCFKEGSGFVYKANVPSILYQDIVLLDYYVEYKHNATQVSILPDKFAPYMYVEGSSLVRRASDGMDLPVEFVIPKLKITTALSFTLTSSGDPSTFNFQGDAYPDFSKFDLTRKVLADIQILDADDNYDLAAGDKTSDPTSYRRYKYNDDTDGDYLWKDPALEGHKNLDYSDAGYDAEHGGPASVNADSSNNGRIYHNP